MRRRNRARKSLAFAAATVVAASLILNALMRTAMPEWADPEYGIRLKRLRADAAREPTRPIVLALGSSRLQMALDPTAAAVPGVLLFNSGQSGCGPRQTLANIRRYRAAGVMPQAFIVEILPALLTGELPERGDWVETCLPWAAHRGHLLSYAGAGRCLPRAERSDQLWTQMKPGGWMPYFHASISADQRAAGLAAARADYVPKLQRGTVADEVRATYAQLIAEAQGTPLLFVLLPESPTFRSWAGPEFEPMLQACLAELRSEADVVDARAWFADETDFADGHHLMRHAATAFSKRFGETRVGPWLRRIGVPATP